MTGDEIREAFLRFFEAKGHLRMPSSSLIPAGDPTLLLTSAGMVQFKPYFTGEMSPPHTRLTTSQKCFRATDVGLVGDSTHLTFFEMLGNFSVGDYFKKEAIQYAWEFVTEHLGLEPERLWASIYQEDDEAYDLWIDNTAVPTERIRRFGEADNFWGPAGNEGPCGPCSEIHYDFGLERGCQQPDCGPNCENVVAGSGLACDRFVELWNLVFMQYYQDAEGARTPLPAPNIDTGMGLERAAIILQKALSIYETDLFTALVQSAAGLCGREYDSDPDTDYALRVVAEHARSSTFLIGDGVAPGNEGRGYVLRRVIRRAIRYGRKLGLEDPFLAEVAGVVIDRMRGQYPDLEQRREFILRVIRLEEERFGQAFERGIAVLNGMLRYRSRHKGAIPEVIEFARGRNPGAENTAAVLEQYGFVGYDPDALSEDQRGEAISGDLVSQLAYSAFCDVENGDDQAMDESLKLLEGWGDTVSGEEAFFLYDTYGFPLEFTQEVAVENGYEVDVEGFEREMEAQRARARASAERFGGDFDAIRAYQDLGVGGTPFLGYEALTAQSVIVGMLVEGQPVERADEGQQVEVLLRETPFYAEKGGQVGDMGEIAAGGSILRVEDTQSPIAGLTAHRCTVTAGSFTLGDAVEARVDARRRKSIACNHTATHLLHATLRQVLGFHVRQHGSLVAPDRLRFDFTHVSPLSQDELREVQRLANEKIRENVPVDWRETTYREAVSQGALAFFGDRYGDQVRVVEVANGVPFSLEVCGGTHVHRTGDIGYCHVVSETGIGSGLRRIEAVTGRSAEALMLEQAASLEEASRRLQAPPGQLGQRVEGLLSELEQVVRRAEALERELLRRQVKELPWKDVAGVAIVSGVLSISATDLLREAGDWLKNDVKSGIVVLGAVLEGRPAMIVMATRDVAAQGFDAGRVVRDAAKAMGGGGGGRPDMGQAGGRDPDKLPDAIQAVEDSVRLWKGQS